VPRLLHTVTSLLRPPSGNNRTTEIFPSQPPSPAKFIARQPNATLKMTSIQKKTPSRKSRKRAAPPKYDPGSTEELKSLVEAQIKIEEAAEGAQGLFANIADQGVDKLRRSAREWGMKLKATEEGQDTSSALLEKEKLQLFDETIQFCNEELSSIEAFKQTDTARLDRLIREFDETFLPKIDAARCRMPWKPDGCYVLEDREEGMCGQHCNS
jgi:hypothetical protein